MPEVLFVCVHNAGRSQMAAALLERHAPDGWSCARPAAHPGTTLNPAVVDVMAEVGIDLRAAGARTEAADRRGGRRPPTS